MVHGGCWQTEIADVRVAVARHQRDPGSLPQVLGPFGELAADER